MPILEIITQLVVETGRTALIEVLAERVRRVRVTPKVRGMAGVRRYVHRAASRRLLNRLRTGIQGRE